MGGFDFDDHGAINGDWMPASPSFSLMTNEDTLAMSSMDEPKASSCGGLMERRAARAGFSATRLNTESIRSGDISKDQEVRSPYLTIPPGLSPTTLLDSPVLLANSLAQPSPTTGKFFFGLSGNHRNSTLISDDHDNFKNNTFEEATSFVFKPIPESGSTHTFNQKNEVRTSSFAPQPFPSFGVSTNSDNTSGFYQSIEPSKTQTLDPHTENSPYLDEPLEEDRDQKSGSQAEEDGYNWRKYGQKQVKGSEYPRSYYKCTHPNCPVKKKVERSYEGYVTEIIYKGDHSHPKLPLLDGKNSDGDLVWSVQECSSNGGGPQYEAADVVEGSCTFSNDGDGGRDDDRVTHGSLGLGYDGEGEEPESESKRRRIETYASEISGATRAISEPRIVVQTTSEVDILDDGFRWRKYGQKVVKGNPNPRSYYKCTSPGCNVRKHVERASNDLASVITTYEGKHNHEVPIARNSSHANSNGPNTLTSQQAHSNGAHMQRPDPCSRMQSGVGRFSRNSLGFSGHSNLGLGGLGHDQGKIGVMQVHPYMGGQIRAMGDNAGFVLREPKVEPVVDSSLKSTGGSAVYQQIMSQLQR